MTVSAEESGSLRGGRGEEPLVQAELLGSSCPCNLYAVTRNASSRRHQRQPSRKLTEARAFQRLCNASHAPVPSGGSDSGPSGSNTAAVQALFPAIASARTCRVHGKVMHRASCVPRCAEPSLARSTTK